MLLAVLRPETSPPSFNRSAAFCCLRFFVLVLFFLLFYKRLRLSPSECGRVTLSFARISGWTHHADKPFH